MTKDNTIKIGTRGSPLAITQTNTVIDMLKQADPCLEFDVQIIKTAGDKITSAPFSKIGEMGVFVRELESALLDNRIDLAVHSLKDLQTDLPDGLTLGAIFERKWVRDAIVSVSGVKLDDLPAGSIIGTSSARRKGLLASENRSFDIRECRGNLQKRMEKLKRGEFDAIILAEAGLIRMDITEFHLEFIDAHRFIPAVGQGALGIEIRENDTRIQTIVELINDNATYIACTEERDFLREMGGGCHSPVGGYLYYENNDAVFLAFTGTTDGSWFTKPQLRVPVADIKGLGLKMAELIKNKPGIESFFEEVNNDASQG